MTIDPHCCYTFIVTGASGNIGRHIIPLLARSGSSILAVGRDTAKLQMLYGQAANVDVADYADLARHISCNTLLHLAARNNNKPGSVEDFMRANVDFAMRVCADFQRMNGRRFINISSIQSLDDDKASSYAQSKKQGRQRIVENLGNRLDDVYIGYFHDAGYYGERLKILSRLGFVGRWLFSLFKIVKPTTSARSLAEYISGPAHALPFPGILTDDLNRMAIYRAITRVCDLAVAVAILVGLSPILLALWVWVRFDSPGPAIFAQTRVGKNRVPFTLYKFRTMKRDTASVGTHELGASSVTRAGRFLRRTKLDELPQAVNLLRGDMTLVGPRPCLPVQQELIDARLDRGVFAMKPGITGYAQIREIDMSRPHELARSDYIYLKLQSLALNFKILLLTVLGRGAGDRVALLEKS